MGGGGGGFLPPFDSSMWSARLAVVAAALFVLSLVGLNIPVLGLFINHTFVMTPHDVLHGEVWQLLTYTVFDLPNAKRVGDVIWTLLMILFFWSFGNTVELQVGPRRYLKYIFGFTGVGAVLTCLLSLPFPSISGVPFGGLSVAFTALTIVFAELNPDSPILFGLLIPVAGRWLVGLTLALLVLGSLASSPILYLPHFGAVAAAELTLRLDIRPRHLMMRLRAWQLERGVRRKSRKFTVINGDKDHDDFPPKGGYLN